MWWLWKKRGIKYSVIKKIVIPTQGRNPKNLTQTSVLGILQAIAFRMTLYKTVKLHESERMGDWMAIWLKFFPVFLLPNAFQHSAV